jgi:hypothetical protein
VVNEDEIRTRAYFYFTNRTGANWQDPTSNWTQAEAEEKALAAARTTDISGELFTYRPLSQLIPTLVLPAIDVKVANGTIAPTVAVRFRDTVTEFKRLIESRKVLLFPPFALTHVVDFIDSGSFWNNTSTIANPKQEVNRHGIAHGVSTGFETQELALSAATPVLRRLKDDEVVRPPFANRNTVRALEDRGLIVAGEGDDPLRIEWHLKNAKD